MVTVGRPCPPYSFASRCQPAVLAIRRTMLRKSCHLGLEVQCVTTPSVQSREVVPQLAREPAAQNLSRYMTLILHSVTADDHPDRTAVGPGTWTPGIR